ncbi:pickpocket protein 28-like [Hetaerina americana]|uniref:pickpocket protein 28-like n=1 Tax=Hetaerina americana TaxID=62018 RepID=UPI003A7F180A
MASLRKREDKLPTLIRCDGHRCTKTGDPPQKNSYASVSAVALDTGYASGHMLKRSAQVRQYRWSVEDDSGPTISKWMCLNLDVGLDKGFLEPGALNIRIPVKMRDFLVVESGKSRRGRDLAIEEDDQEWVTNGGGTPSSPRKLSRVLPSDKNPHNSANVEISMVDNDNDSEQQQGIDLGEKQMKEYLLCGFRCRKNFQGATSYFQEFSENTSLHGLKYMGEERRPLIERIFWIIAFGLSIYACSQIILKVYRKWENSPVIVSFAESLTPVWQIPFPAVTICPEFKYLRSVFKYSYTKQMMMNGEDISLENRRKLEYSNLLCQSDGFNESVLLETGTDHIQFFQEAAPPCIGLLHCNWEKKKKRCCGNLFRPILTDEGVCYTFNMLSTNQIFSKNMTVEGFDESYGSTPIHTSWTEWNADDGYPNGESIEAYPKRGPGAGATSGLHILLTAKPEEYDNCVTMKGFKVLLHNPSEFPMMKQQFFRAQFGQDAAISVKPNIMGTSADLQDYTPSRRQCIFQRESHLWLFTHYTQQNCELECIVNATLKNCQCMMFFIPRHNFPICGVGSLKCINKVTEQLQQMEIVHDISHDRGKTSNSGECNCLPACMELNYEAEPSTGEKAVKFLIGSKNGTRGLAKIQVGKLSIFFKERQFTTKRRDQLYDQTDFIANCGGLLGLFMGFSFLSLVEIVYFFTFRLFNNIRGKRRKEK